MFSAPEPTYEHVQVDIFGPIPSWRIETTHEGWSGLVEDALFVLRNDQRRGVFPAGTWPSRFRNRKSRVRFWQKQAARFPRDIKRWQNYQRAVEGYLHFTGLIHLPIPAPETAYEAGLLAAIYQAWFDGYNALLDQATQEAAKKRFRRLQSLLINHYNKLYGE